MDDNKKFDEGTFVNEAERRIIIQIAYDGEGSMVRALGNLSLAEDVVKQTFSRWRVMDQRGKGIIVPRVEGNGK